MPVLLSKFAIKGFVRLCSRIGRLGSNLSELRHLPDIAFVGRPDEFQLDGHAVSMLWAVVNFSKALVPALRERFE